MVCASLKTIQGNDKQHAALLHVAFEWDASSTTAFQKDGIFLHTAVMCIGLQEALSWEMDSPPACLCNASRPVQLRLLKVFSLRLLHDSRCRDLLPWEVSSCPLTRLCLLDRIVESAWFLSLALS